MTDLFAPPTIDELTDAIDSTFTGLSAAVMVGSGDRRTALLRVVTLCVSILVAEPNATVEKFAAMIEHTLGVYRKSERDLVHHHRVAFPRRRRKRRGLQR